MKIFWHEYKTPSTDFVLTYVGLYSVFVQSVGIGFLTKRFKENTIIVTALGVMFLGLLD